MTLWVGTGWKMNMTLAEARSYSDILKSAEVDGRLQPFVIPPFTLLREVKGMLADTRVKVGAQNMHWEDSGAWTGEISPVMLKDCGVDLVELGHSERREHFRETDETVALKTAAAIRHGLTPLICIGETAEEKAAGAADRVLRAQVEGALRHLDDTARTAPILLAYEPVWAIGAGGVPASPDYAQDRHERIIEVAQKVTGRRLPCLYGGSVNAENCEELIVRPHIDGLFIGRAAWRAEGYLEILARCAAIS